MRIVLSSRDVASAWASRKQFAARNGKGSLFFENLTVYSYGKHFPIARWLGETSNVCLLTTRSHSVTTAKHISRVRYAIPASAEVIHVSDPSAQLDDSTLDEMQEKIERNIIEVERARKLRPYKLATLRRNVEQFKRVAQLIHSSRDPILPKGFELRARVLYGERLYQEGEPRL
jgi:hypothetical protein